MIAVPIACAIDASVAIKWFINEPDSAIAQQLLVHLTADPHARFFVPDFFYLECGNILWKHAHQRGTLTAPAAVAKMSDLLALPLQSITTSSLAALAVQLALDHGVTVYDACYVAASFQLNVPLITADDRLVRKFAGTAYRILLLSALTIPPLPPPTGSGAVP